MRRQTPSTTGPWRRTSEAKASSSPLVANRRRSPASWSSLPGASAGRPLVESGVTVSRPPLVIWRSSPHLYVQLEAGADDGNPIFPGYFLRPVPRPPLGRVAGLRGQPFGANTLSG